MEHIVLSTALLFKIIFVVAAVIIIVGIIGVARRFFKRAASSAEAQVVKELVNLVSENGMDFVSEPEHPRLISNMNRIYLPQIERDFPEFNWDEIKLILEKEIVEKFGDRTDFEIEETVISRYEKSGQKYRISCETAASFDDGELTRHFCIQSVLCYLNSKTADGGPQALTCPRCSAPLTRRPDGEIVCEFCDTVVVGTKLWTVTEIKEKE